MVSNVMKKGSAKRSALRQVRDVEDLGAVVSCNATRDDIVYTAQSHSENFDDVVRIIAEAVQTPRIVDREIAELSEVLQADIAAQKADATANAVELLHGAAFRERGLGLSVVVPEHNLHHVSSKAVQGNTYPLHALFSLFLFVICLSCRVSQAVLHCGECCDRCVRRGARQVCCARFKGIQPVAQRRRGLTARIVRFSIPFCGIVSFSYVRLFSFPVSVTYVRLSVGLFAVSMWAVRCARLPTVRPRCPCCLACR